MKVVTRFWQRYVGGELSRLSRFISELRRERVVADPPDTSYERFLGMELHDLAHDAPKRLAYPSFFNSDAHLRQNDRADWQQTDPRIQLFAASLIETLRKRQIPMFVHSAFRTQAEQDAAFDRGVSKLKWPRASHCQGAAVDIVHSRYAWELTQAEWAFIGKVGKEVLERINASRPAGDTRRDGTPVPFYQRRFEVEWGGDWAFYDPAHWEIVGWRNKIDRPVALEPVRKTPRSILSRL